MCPRLHSSFALTLALTCAALAPEAGARQESVHALAGRWIGDKPRAGRIEPDRFVLELLVGDGGSIAGTLEVHGLEVPLAGSLDEATQVASFSAAWDSRVARFEVRLEEEHLVGDLDQWGSPFRIRAQRASPELEAEPAYWELTDIEVAFPLELPERTARSGLPADTAAVFRQEVLALMRDEDVVGLSTAVVRGGRVIDIRTFGWEDLERGIPASEKTMYRWASVSKPLTAAAALLLVEDNRLELDADVRTLVPEWPEWPDGPGVVTPRLLLQHQAGIVHYANMKPRTLRDRTREHPWADTITALDMFSESDLLFPPGERFRYSTPGYVLLGAAIERAAGTPYPRVVQERICAPLGMTSMRPERIWEEIDHRAAGYGRSAKGGIFRANDDDISWKTPAGGWISTVEDLGRFVAGLMGNELLSLQSQLAMWTETEVAGAKTGFGLGIQVRNTGDGLLLFHAGGQIKAATFFACSPDEQLGVAVMSNTEGTLLGNFTLRLLEACR